MAHTKSKKKIRKKSKAKHKIKASSRTPSPSAPHASKNTPETNSLLRIYTVEIPHEHHLVSKLKSGGMLGTELSPKEARYRARLPESTLVLEKKAIKDTAEINAHLSGGDRPTRVTAGFFDGREYYIVSSPKKKSGGRVSKTRGEARVYKEHDSAHPSKKLIPVGSCKIEDPTREGKSMLGLSGAEATACLALLELPTSETRKNVKAVIGSPSARDRGKLTGKGWRAHQSPGKRSTPPSNFFSRPEVQSAAEKLGVATPIRKRDEDKEKKPYKGRALKF